MGLLCDVWHKCRIQQAIVQDNDELAPPQTVQALPPEDKLEHGLCNCVLVQVIDDADVVGVAGHRAAQLRLVFRPKLSHNHPLHNVPLAYVYWFSEFTTTQPNLKMYRVEYQRDTRNHRVGSVIKLQSIRRLIQLVPVYGARMNPALTSVNSMDLWRKYYVNSFFNKETYQAVW
ncbi:hypothetical protein FRC14_001069 [Serendipita sp. 396]|nr:hypothetical protein FRC14_001069 [Serendipita sp. 396]KAG8775369.1 hypothetical protein FRC15_000595 [Serendipita sp. 397]KAG8857781.1 hypothetical protein FRC20_000198 [Serendipita sp. 405]